MNVRKSVTKSLSIQTICTYFSNTQIVLGHTYGIFKNSKRLQEHHWRNQCAGKCKGQDATLSLGHPIFPPSKSGHGTYFWGIDDTISTFLGKNLYLGSIGIAKPTLTFQSKINIYFPRCKVAMGPISQTFARGTPLEQDVCR